MHRVTSSVPFKRMMLVDELMLQKLKEEALTGYNPTAKTLVQHKDAMDSALMAVNGGPLADERRLGMYLANEQRFQQLLRNATASATDRKTVAASAMPSTMVQTEPTATATQGVQADEGMAAQAVETGEPVPGFKVEPNLARQFQIPAQYDRKFDALVSTMASHPDIVSVTADNELVVGGKIQKGTSFADLMRSLFVESGSPSTGLTHMVAALHHIGVNEEMLSSKRAKEAMRNVAMLTGKAKAAAAEPAAKTSKKVPTQQGTGKVKRRRIAQSPVRVLPPGNHVRVLKLYK